MGASHQQQAWQVVEEHVAHPGRHAMCARSLEVPVYDDNGDKNGDNVHDKREKKILGDKRNLDGRRRQYLRHEQQEHDESQQDGNTHRHLFAGVSG